MNSGQPEARRDFRQALVAVAVLQGLGLFFALHVGSRVQAPTSLATATTPP